MLLRLGRLLRMAGRDIMVLWHVCRHPGTPRALKLAALFAALYVISPIDILPDWLAVVGWADDVTLLALLIPVLLRLVPEPILAQARMAVERRNWRSPA